MDSVCPGEEFLILHLQDRPRANIWKGCEFKVCFICRVRNGITPRVGPPITIIKQKPQAWSFFYSTFNAFPLLLNCSLPAWSSVRWLKLPFQKVRQKQSHSISQFTLFTFAYVFNLLRYMLDINS